jgi:hypothetical protein
MQGLSKFEAACLLALAACAVYRSEHYLTSRQPDEAKWPIFYYSFACTIYQPDDPDSWLYPARRQRPGADHVLRGGAHVCEHV